MLGAPWTLRVENLTKGWSLETYTDEPAPDTLAPMDAVIADGYKGTFGWNDYPADVQPRTAQLELRLGSADKLRAMGADPGDLMDVHLFAEWHVAVPSHDVRYTWHRCTGFLDEPEVPALDGRGLVLKLAVADPLAQLAEVVVDDPNPWPSETLGARLSRIAQAARINIASMNAYTAAATMGPMTVNNKGALALLQECLAGVQVGGDQLVLRGTLGSVETELIHDQVTYEVFYRGDDPMFVVDPGTGISTGTLKPTYYIDVVGRESLMSAPYVLVAELDGAVRVAQRDKGVLTDVTGGAALDAGDVLRDGTQWIKSRAAAISQVKLVGLDAAGEEKSVVAQYPDLVRADGPSTRVVQTSRLIDAGAAAVALALLPDLATASPDWTADTFTVTTRDMTDAEWQSAVKNLYPDVVSLGMQLPVAIVGVDDLNAPTGNDLSGVLEQATVQLSKGVLSVVGQLRNEQLRPSGLGTNLITWADMRSEQVHNVPGLAWAGFTYRDVASAKVFDADGHAGMEQLTIRMFRLIGVDT